MPVTIQDIAKESGVSIATVSRVINGTKEVSPELRQRVVEVIERKNFKPNPIARGLVTKTTHTIGIVIPDISNPVFGELTKGINSVCQQKGYSLMVFESIGQKDKEIELLRLMAEKTVDGALFAGVEVDTILGQEMQSKEYPIVLVAQEAADKNIRLHTVIHDNVAATYDAVQFLIQNGHRNIAFIGGSRHDFSSVIKRLSGYRKALADNGIEFNPSYMAYGDFTFKSGYEAMRALYEENTVLPTAVMSCSDTMALGAIKYLKQAGLNVPEDMSVMGFDDMDIAVYSTPELSTVRVSYFDEGVQAAKILFSLMQKKKEIPWITNVPHKIIRRQSVMRIN